MIMLSGVETVNRNTAERVVTSMANMAITTTSLVNNCSFQDFLACALSQYANVAPDIETSPARRKIEKK